MAMQINENYHHSKIDDAERLKEKQAAEKAKKAQETRAESPSKLPEPQDEYISSEKSGKKPTGLYWVGQDENGSRKIFFDDPKAVRGEEKEEPKTAGAEEEEATKAAGAEEEEAPNAEEARSKKSADGKEPKIGGNNKEEPETCVADTNAVDREIRKLKEKKQKLEQQIQSASGDEKKTKELEKKLAQVEQELSQKDNDTYRRQHTVFSQAE